jgi:hypothetical protein
MDIWRTMVPSGTLPDGLQRPVADAIGGVIELSSWRRGHLKASL